MRDLNDLKIGLTSAVAGSSKGTLARELYLNLKKKMENYIRAGYSSRFISKK